MATRFALGVGDYPESTKRDTMFRGDAVSCGSGDAVSRGSGDKVSCGSGDEVSCGSGDKVSCGSGDARGEKGGTREKPSRSPTPPESSPSNPSW